MAPYLTLLPEGAGQRHHELPAVFDALRWLMRAGAPCHDSRMLAATLDAVPGVRTGRRGRPRCRPGLRS